MYVLQGKRTENYFVNNNKTVKRKQGLFFVWNCERSMITPEDSRNVQIVRDLSVLSLFNVVCFVLEHIFVFVLAMCSSCPRLGNCSHLSLECSPLNIMCFFLCWSVLFCSACLVLCVLTFCYFILSLGVSITIYIYIYNIQQLMQIYSVVHE